MSTSMFYPAKITYIVDRETFDAVIDIGFLLTMRVRCKLKGMPPIKHEYYKDVKKLLSQWLHRHNVYIRTFKSGYVGLWDTEVYVLPKGNPNQNFDITTQNISELEFLNPQLICEIQQILGKGKSIIEEQEYVQSN